MTRSQGALLVALGIDNVGSGLFLPLALVYVTEVVGLPLGLAGTAVTVGTVSGMLAPPLTGRLVDRFGPRAVVIAAQLVQASGVSVYLAADGFGSVVMAAVLLAAGQQSFYCALFVLIADVAGDGPKDRPFAVVAMVRSACFGAGGLVAGVLLIGKGPAGYRTAVAIDAASFLVAALVLGLLLRIPHTGHQEQVKPLGLLRDRPYLALILISGLFALTGDFFLIGIPVFVLDQLHGPPWLPGAILALLTAVTSVGGTIALRATRRLTRTEAMAFGATGYAAWCGISLAAVLLPPGWLPAYLLACTLFLAVAALMVGPRQNALAEAAAPRAVRGRYLAAFQYGFTAAQVFAPAVTALFALGIWVPWLVVATSACLAVAGLRWVSSRLPPHALTA